MHGDRRQNGFHSAKHSFPLLQILFLLITFGGSYGRPNTDLGFHDHHDPNAKSQGRCESVTIPMCRDMPYNETFLPNNLGHATQEEAGYEAHQYYALVKVA